MMILNFMKFVNEFFGYLIRFVWLLFYPKAVLAARLLTVQMKAIAYFQTSPVDPQRANPKSTSEKSRNDEKVTQAQ
jgi:hypothetical protein